MGGKSTSLVMQGLVRMLTHIIRSPPLDTLQRSASLYWPGPFRFRPNSGRQATRQG